MTPLRPLAKVGIVILGFIVAAAVAWVAVELRQLLSYVPAVERSGGMYAFGDMLFGLAVFGLGALVPLGLGLYWLRQVESFWRTLSRLGLVWAATGFIAVAVNHYSTPPDGWRTLLANIRFGIMPLTALGLQAAAVFAPQQGFRWRLIVAGACDGLLFVGVIVAKFSGG